MKYKIIDTRYKNLETKVLAALRQEVEISTITSKHMQSFIIPVNLFDYTELAIVSNNLTFLNEEGYHYSLYARCDLKDLISILTKV